MKEFTLPEEYMTSVTIRTVHTRLKDPDNPTDEDLLMIMKGIHQSVFHSSQDHPEFAKLREQLSADGYIKIEQSYWNGDRVLKQFKLNGKKFKVGDKFACASAMGIQFKVKREMKK